MQSLSSRESFSFGNALQTAREEELQWTQTQLAESLNTKAPISLTAQNIEEWEQDQKLETLTPEIFTVLAATLYRELEKKHPEKVGAFEDFHAELMELLQETRERIQGGETIESLDNSFGKSLSEYRRQAGLTGNDDLLTAVAANTTLTHQNIAAIEAGEEPKREWHFMKKVQALDDLSPSFPKLEAAYERDSGKRWAIKAEQKPKHKVSNKVIQRVDILNQAKRELARHFLPKANGNSSLTDENFQAIATRLSSWKKPKGIVEYWEGSIRGLSPLKVSQIFSPIDAAEFREINPLKSLDYQKDQTGRAVDKIFSLEDPIGIINLALARMRREFEPNSDERKAFKDTLKKYTLARRNLIDELYNWKDELQVQTMQR